MAKKDYNPMLHVKNFILFFEAIKFVIQTLRINTAIHHTDNELLQQWQQGDENAFEVLYKRYLNELLQIAYRKISDFETAREVVQEAFITFYSKKKQINDNPVFYLKKVLKFKVLEYYKKQTKAAIIDLDAANNILYETGSSANDMIDEKETMVRITEFVSILPPQQRKVFLLSREANKSNKEIAEKLGISVKAVEAHITKALKYLREHIDYHALWILTLPLFTHSL